MAAIRISVVHIYWAGQTLCGIKDDPSRWPKGDSWVGLDMQSKTNCETCRKEALTNYVESKFHKGFWAKRK